METKDEDMIMCVCKKEFTLKSIFKHLHHPKKKSCMENFDRGKYESLMDARDESRQQYKRVHNKGYHEKHRPELREREKDDYAENPSPAKKKSKNYYAENKEKISTKRKESYSENEENRDKKKRDNKEYYGENSEKLKKQKQDAIDEQSKDARILRFRRAIMEGPIYVCHSCNRMLYKNGTQT